MGVDRPARRSQSGRFRYDQDAHFPRRIDLPGQQGPSAPLCLEFSGRWERQAHCWSYRLGAFSRSIEFKGQLRIAVPLHCRPVRRQRRWQEKPGTAMCSGTSEISGSMPQLSSHTGVPRLGAASGSGHTYGPWPCCS